MYDALCIISLHASTTLVLLPDLSHSLSLSLPHANSHSLQVGEIDTPTILIIRDKGGAVFGAFASQQWERRPAFYGDLKAFLFSFLPAAAIYRAAGVNFNVQWVRK